MSEGGKNKDSINYTHSRLDWLPRENGGMNAVIYLNSPALFSTMLLSSGDKIARFSFTTLSRVLSWGLCTPHPINLSKLRINEWDIYRAHGIFEYISIHKRDIRCQWRLLVLLLFPNLLDSLHFHCLLMRESLPLCTHCECLQEIIWKLSN